MKCELCKKAEATQAIVREGCSEDDEIYVCESCAKAEKAKRQRKSQRTRKITGLPPGVSMSITEISRTPDGETVEDITDDPPPFIGAIMDAFKDMVDGIESAAQEMKKRREDESEYEELPASRAAAAFRVRNAFHLEGLHLIGELDATKRALHALGMDLVGLTVDGVKETGHIYRLKYRGSSERAKRVVEDLLREEKNARIRLRNELTRIFGDSLCRALAILKNCRLLANGELFDLLSPMRLAAREKMLDGITLGEIDKMMNAIDLSDDAAQLSPEERDRVDAERADEMNRRFEEVVLNDVL